VRRLQAEFGDDVHLDAAYGDSDGDREMLAIAEERGLKVFQGTP
jgi:phosphatidylglycerophosphatase C